MKIEKIDGKDVMPKSEWTFAMGDFWRVFVVAWHSGTEWKWNVYVDLSEKHPAFSFSRDGVRAFPFHGGVSSDTLLIYDTPAPKYDFERIIPVRRVGSDYAHDGDWYGEDSPADGIPSRIHVDAMELVQYMRDWESGAAKKPHSDEDE